MSSSCVCVCVCVGGGGLEGEGWGWGWGVTDIGRGYGDERPYRHPFHASPLVCKSVQAKVSSQAPFDKKNENLAPLASLAKV